KADNLLYTTEKTLKEYGEKVDAQTRSNIESALSDLKDAMKGEDADLINKRIDALTTASHKLAEAMYASAASQAGGASGTASQGAGASDASSSAKDDNVVDAEFEEVKGERGN
ncbi:MAG: Hsp70 family protein, partial [Deltaproteobacteria bacterium]|nr:Hsp70 family protein [Deltaproteobacteria bacterium]